MPHLIWQYQYQPPDAAALERMRQALKKPDQPMPEAWFMSGTVWMDWLMEVEPQNLQPREFERVIREIWSGFAFFRQAAEDRWTPWYRYLLPYAIPLMNTNSVDLYGEFLPKTFDIFHIVFPLPLEEVYPGFRDDIILTLGTRVVPEISARDVNTDGTKHNRVLIDLWYTANDPSLLGIGNFIDEPIRFGLTYLTIDEIDTWAASIVKIDSPQWRLMLMSWWVSFLSSDLLKEDAVLKHNFEHFNALLHRLLPHTVFLQWKQDILSQNQITYDETIVPIWEPTKPKLSKS